MFGCFEWSPILLVDTLPYFDGKIYISSILAYILTTDKTSYHQYTSILAGKITISFETTHYTTKFLHLQQMSLKNILKAGSFGYVYK